MIPLAANIPLTLCSVLVRRFIDSYTGRLPLAVASNTVPTASTVALFTGALVCLYHQLRKGTIVKVGLGKRISSMIRNSRHTIQRRVKNNSWFLRNINACRKKCTEAVFKIVQPSNDSLVHIQAETGSVETAIVGETTSLPIFNRRTALENRRCVKRSDGPALENLYSNDSFNSNDCSTCDVTVQNAKKKEPNRRKSINQVSPLDRPVTRNFRKSLAVEEGFGDGRRLPSKKKKKSDHVSEEAEDKAYSIEETLSVETNEASNRLRNSLKESTPEKLRNRRNSERLKKQTKIQKITRKTRSGRVYAYRL